ncbi:hypothetical protein DB30_06171 [Enhygromyxa salina]|uniref:Uncharacterized protein n=1 Tax=Enhygromyxa salina TaxID=215803 RepID=A0A0C2D4F7_9BACT|nr:hypothetical protein DB30_06171 [Enhygromyxa salina]
MRVTPPPRWARRRSARGPPRRSRPWPHPSGRGHGHCSYRLSLPGRSSAPIRCCH